MRRHGRAARRCSAARHLTPPSPPPLSPGNYANLLKSQPGRADEAERKYRKALASAPHNATVLGNYANFLFKQRSDFGAAKRMYLRALKADPDHPQVARN